MKLQTPFQILQATPSHLVLVAVSMTQTFYHSSHLQYKAFHKAMFLRRNDRRPVVRQVRQVGFTFRSKPTDSHYGVLEDSEMRG
jgi:hypothetical protein